MPDTPIEIVVCVPTYRRPQLLARTLDSLAAQAPDEPFAVVVVDNDAALRQGVAVAEPYFADGRLLGRSVLESDQGNCHAINTGFATALDAYPGARYVLMIDDDEIAAPRWIALMTAAARSSGAGIVGGPVYPRLAAGGRAGLARHPAFQPAYGRDGPVPVIYGSGNCLLARAVLERLGPRPLDTAYNFLGGGDTDLFVRARHAGIAFHWAADAVITETVPPERTTARWLALRGLRIGAINYRIERKHALGTRGRLAVAAKSLALVPAALVRALPLLLRTREPLIAVHPILVAAGRCLAALGVEPQPYRAGSAR